MCSLHSREHLDPGSMATRNQRNMPNASVLRSVFLPVRPDMAESSLPRLPGGSHVSIADQCARSVSATPYASSPLDSTLSIMSRDPAR